MTSDQRKKLSEIKQFKQLIAYLRDEMGWPIKSDSDFEELTYEYTTTELGIDDKSAAQIQEIKRLRPLSAKQPWGVFFVKFEPKKLPVVALRRILGQVALKKRASANPADRTMWAQEDLLFISNYGEGDDRQITLAHFSVPTGGHTLPSLKVLGWDSKDTVLHLEAVARELTEQLSWPADETDADAWRAKWRAAFTLGHQEVIKTSERLSIRLAQLARAVRDRITAALAIETPDGQLSQLLKAFRDSLIQNLTPDDFADMYAQTIAYGLLSSRIADPGRGSIDDLATHMKLSPFLKELLDSFLKAGGRDSNAALDFDEIGVGDVVELLDQANMEAVIEDFGNRNPQEDPVIHFYELFLKEYDAVKKIQRGVFYTPLPVVKYIVRQAHEQIQATFKLEDGLASTVTWGEMMADGKLPRNSPSHGYQPSPQPESSEPFVQILDPATGTGTFLVEVIDVIYDTMTAKWRRQGVTGKEQTALWNAYVTKNLLPRLFAYEIEMAPYAVAHLKIGLKLKETGYNFSGDATANIFLTNSLEAPTQQLSLVGFTALARQGIAVNNVKSTKKFTVVIGNPPYSVISSNMSTYAKSTVEKYRFVAGTRINERKISIQDDYVKFFAFAQDRIAESGVGIVGYVTNHAFIDNPTFRGMRYSLLEFYSRVEVLNLHGNANRPPHGLLEKPDEPVFQIMQGVAVSSLARGANTAGQAEAFYGELVGPRDGKFKSLESIDQLTSAIKPTEPFYFLNQSKSDLAEEESYLGFLSLPDWFNEHVSGIGTSRDSFAIDIDRRVLELRIRDYLNPNFSDDEIKAKYQLEDATSWSIAASRQECMREGLKPELFQRISYRPFVEAWVYMSKALVWRTRGRIMASMNSGGNIGLVSVRQVAEEHFSHALSARMLVDSRLTTSNKGTAYVWPGWVLSGDVEEDEGSGLFSGVESNIATSVVKALTALGLNFSSGAIVVGGQVNPEQIVQYLLAILHSEAYRETYREFLRRDFPRIPLPLSSEMFTELVAIGQRIDAIYTASTPTSENQLPSLVGIRPKVERASWANSHVWLDDSHESGFKGVDQESWDMRVGGYQILDRWLKQRKGQTLSEVQCRDFATLVTRMRKLGELVAQVEICINEHGGWPNAFRAPRVPKSQ